MQEIAKEFSDRHFTYTQLEREGDIAIYEQRHKDSQGYRFEVVRIRVHKEHTWPDGTMTPEREAYPGSSAWGKDAWTFFSLAAAQQHKEHLRQASVHAAPAFVEEP